MFVSKAAMWCLFLETKVGPARRGGGRRALLSSPGGRCPAGRPSQAWGRCLFHLYFGCFFSPGTKVPLPRPDLGPAQNAPLQVPIIAHAFWVVKFKTCQGSGHPAQMIGPTQPGEEKRRRRLYERVAPTCVHDRPPAGWRSGTGSGEPRRSLGPHDRPRRKGPTCTRLADDGLKEGTVWGDAGAGLAVKDGVTPGSAEGRRCSRGWIFQGSSISARRRLSVPSGKKSRSPVAGS
jgi:hypothetical protein